jgi:hypothetical protein
MDFFRVHQSFCPTTILESFCPDRGRVEQSDIIRERTLIARVGKAEKGREERGERREEGGGRKAWAHGRMGAWERGGKGRERGGGKQTRGNGETAKR